MLEITKNLININYKKGVTIIPKYIVIHETDNADVGANAMANRNYFANHPEAQVSTHFVVDDHSIVQCLELNQEGWHVGVIYGTPLVPDANNANTVGIEICVNADGDYTKARQNAIELVKYLLPILKLTPDKVIRHYDVCKKECPRKMIDNPSLWIDFLAQVSVNQTVPIINATQTPKVDNEVLKIQQTLNKLQIAKLVEDGIMGNNTTNAIKKFQTITHATADGIVGANTTFRINEIMSKPTLSISRHPETFAVMFIQNAIGINNNGVFDEVTKEAIMVWQKKNNLTPDGIVGVKSWSKLIIS